MPTLDIDTLYKAAGRAELPKKLLDILTRQEYAGTAVGNLTPRHIGDWALDTTNDDWYLSIGITNTDWVAVAIGITADQLAVLEALADVTATAAELNRVADVSGRIVNCTTDTLAVTELLHDGKTITLNRAAGIAVTLPVASAGLRFRFVVGTTFTGAASIKSVAGTDIMIGHALMGNDGDNAVVDWPSLAATTNDTIDLFGTANSTGGIAGQVIEIEGLAANLWHVSIRGDAAGSEATPFANTVA
jgi:hypothetical protein